MNTPQTTDQTKDQANTGPKKSDRPGTLLAIATARCPECRIGKISKGLLGMERRCPHCRYDLNPESGFFLGAMMIGFFGTAFLTIPPVIFMKVMGVEDRILLTYPFIQYLVLCPFLTYYAKILWVYVAHRADKRMNR